MADLRKQLAIALAATIVASTTAAFADPHPALPQRPTLTTAAIALEPGSMQLELGYLLARPAPDTTLHFTPLAFRLAAHEAVELRLLWDGAAFAEQRNEATRQGVGDLTSQLLMHALGEGTWAPALGFLVGVRAPIGSRPFSLEATRVDARLALSKTLAFARLDLNSGLFVDIDADGDSLFRLPLSIQAHFRLFGLLGLFGEVEGWFPMDEESGDPPFTGRLGLQFEALDELVIDGFVGFGLTETAPEIALGLGLTWNFGDFY